MSVKLITIDVWDVLTTASQLCRKPAYVAVAYFGKGAADLLPLPAESSLVVNASEDAVKKGQTHPRDLQKMRRRHVAIYSAKNLHAKVFAFDKAVFVGSANVSKNSANALQEAVVRITDAATIRAARSFIKSLCLESLGPAELKRLQKLYKPPQFFPGYGKKNGLKRQLPFLRVATTNEVDISKKLEMAFEAGRKEAIKKKKQNSGFTIGEFYWDRPDIFRNGQLVIQVHGDAFGRRIVSPPGHVVHSRAYRDGKTRRTLIYVELPDGDWRPFSRFGKEAKKILGRGGIKNESAAKKLMRFW